MSDTKKSGAVAEDAVPEDAMPEMPKGNKDAATFLKELDGGLVNYVMNGRARLPSLVMDGNQHNAAVLAGQIKLAESIVDAVQGQLKLEV